MPRWKSSPQMRARGLRGLALHKEGATARVCPSAPRPSAWEAENRMQDAFPGKAENYGTAVNTVCTCTRVCVLGPGCPRSACLCRPSSCPNMGPQAPWVPVLPPPWMRMGMGFTSFSVILVIELPWAEGGGRGDTVNLVATPRRSGPSPVGQHPPPGAGPAWRGREQQWVFCSHRKSTS